VDAEARLQKTKANLKNSIVAAQKIKYFVEKMLRDIENPAEENQPLKSAPYSVNVGLGYGECMLCHVGGVFGRTAYFAVGDAINQAQDSLKIASAHRDVIVSKQVWRVFDSAKKSASQKSAYQTKSKSNPFNAERVHEDGLFKIALDIDQEAKFLAEQRLKDIGQNPGNKP